MSVYWAICDAIAYAARRGSSDCLVEIVQSISEGGGYGPTFGLLNKIDIIAGCNIDSWITMHVYIHKSGHGNDLSNALIGPGWRGRGNVC